MKEIKELKFEELSTEQKLGMIHSAVVNYLPGSEHQNEFLYDRIRNHALGAIWIPSNAPYTEDFIKKVKEIADYPILIMTDAERGFGEYQIGPRNSVGRTNDVENAYIYGKSVGVAAKKLGYDVVCSPILDVLRDGSPRSYGPDKEFVAKMAAAEARGMQDAGLMAVGKHYPGAEDSLPIDSHMAEAISLETKEELVDNGFGVYKKLIDEGVLSGIMTSHHKTEKVDPVYPASLSKITLDMIKKEGFNGFFITDAIDMMGIRAKFGEVESKGMAVEAGNDFILTYSLDPIGDQKIINTCYEKGIITDERLDEAVKKVLEMQHKSLEMEKTMITELSDEEYERLRNIEKNAVCAKVDEGLTTSISKDGKHLFVVMLRNEMNPADVAVDTFKSNWLFPDKIKKRILELFPNSQVHFIHQMPTARQNQLALIYATKNEDVVFLTFSETIAYVGQDEITKRVRTLMEAMQYTDKISAVVHFGDPTTLSGLPHIPRYIMGDTYEGSVDACLDVLAGKLEAKGKPVYKYTLN